MTELAHKMDVVAQFHFPGVRGWEDLEPSEKTFVQCAAGRRLNARREANRASQHSRWIADAVHDGTQAIKTLP
jgi:hypothetical protein